MQPNHPKRVSLTPPPGPSLVQSMALRFGRCCRRDHECQQPSIVSESILKMSCPPLANWPNMQSSRTRGRFQNGRICLTIRGALRNPPVVGRVAVRAIWVPRVIFTSAGETLPPFARDRARLVPNPAAHQLERARPAAQLERNCFGYGGDMNAFRGFGVKASLHHRIRYARTHSLLVDFLRCSPRVSRSTRLRPDRVHRLSVSRGPYCVFAPQFPCMHADRHRRCRSSLAPRITSHHNSVP